MCVEARSSNHRRRCCCSSTDADPLNLDVTPSSRGPRATRGIAHELEKTRSNDTATRTLERRKPGGRSPDGARNAPAQHGTHAPCPTKHEAPLRTHTSSARRRRGACLDRQGRNRPATSPRTPRHDRRLRNAGTGRRQCGQRCKTVLHEPDPPSAPRVTAGKAISYCSHCDKVSILGRWQIPVVNQLFRMLR